MNEKTHILGVIVSQEHRPASTKCDGHETVTVVFHQLALTTLGTNNFINGPIRIHAYQDLCSERCPSLIGIFCRSPTDTLQGRRGEGNPPTPSDFISKYNHTILVWKMHTAPLLYMLASLRNLCCRQMNRPFSENRTNLCRKSLWPLYSPLSHYLVRPTSPAKHHVNTRSDNPQLRSTDFRLAFSLDLNASENPLWLVYLFLTSSRWLISCVITCSDA